MSTILPFRKPCARISPQHDPSRVAVNVTAIQRELARDMFNEARIRVLGEAWKLATLADDRLAERDFWERYCEAVKRRSPAMVARLEAVKGLR